MNLQTHILPRRKNTSTYLIATSSTHHNPLAPFISPTCPYLHCRMLDTNIITKFSSTNNKLEKKDTTMPTSFLKTSPMAQDHHCCCSSRVQRQKVKSHHPSTALLSDNIELSICLEFHNFLTNGAKVIELKILCPKKLIKILEIQFKKISLEF